MNSLTGLLQTVSAYLRPILIQDLWSGSGLPTLGADVVSNNVTPPDLTVGSPTNFLRSDSYTFILKDNSGTPMWTNLVYSFVPTNAVTKLVIYHAGHDFGGILGQPNYGGDPAYNAGALVKQLVENGYSVASIGMPFLGTNSWGVGANGTPAPTKTLNYLRFFIEPTIRTINVFTNATSVGMVGISGGGWTTTLAAALDPRITVSAPTAGSLPFYITNVTSRSWEQFLPGLPANTDYTNLYVLGATGGRVQEQILNSADGIFSGNWTTLWPDYATPTAFQASCAGGTWSLYIPQNYSHSFSDDARTNIVNLFNTSTNVAVPVSPYLPLHGTADSALVASSVLASNGVVLPVHSAAPTWLNIGVSNTIFVWSSNDVPPTTFGSYYNGASNLVNKWSQ